MRVPIGPYACASVRTCGCGAAVVDTVEQGFHEEHLELQQSEVDGGTAHGLIGGSDDARRSGDRSAMGGVALRIGGGAAVHTVQSYSKITV